MQGRNICQLGQIRKAGDRSLQNLKTAFRDIIGKYETSMEMTMNQTQKQQAQQDVTNMFVWRLNRRLSEKRENSVNTGILRRMPH